MENYSKNEKVDMLLIYGECRKNAVAASVLYAERFPDRRHPHRIYFSRVEQEFRTEPENEEANFIVSEEMEINVIAFTEVNPTFSTRQIGIECGVSHQTIWKILKKYGFHAFKYQLHQHLYVNDYIRRENYCNWLLQNHVANNTFHFNILFSDESRFTNNGIFNRNNTRYWSRENPRLLRVGNFQERFGFNVWIGILNNRIIGPIFFDGPLTGQRYLQFLRNEIEEILEELPLRILPLIYFQQDGAPPHNARQVYEYLNHRFNDHWIATNGPVRWPARSPDLTPIDFFCGDTLKILYIARHLQQLMTCEIG